jgi:hypothetical protein
MFHIELEKSKIIDWQHDGGCPLVPSLMGSTILVLWGIMRLIGKLFSYTVHWCNFFNQYNMNWMRYGWWWSTQVFQQEMHESAWTCIVPYYTGISTDCVWYVFALKIPWKMTLGQGAQVSGCLAVVVPDMLTIITNHIRSGMWHVPWPKFKQHCPHVADLLTCPSLICS